MKVIPSIVSLLGAVSAFGELWNVGNYFHLKNEKCEYYTESKIWWITEEGSVCHEKCVVKGARKGPTPFLGPGTLTFTAPDDTPCAKLGFTFDGHANMGTDSFHQSLGLVDFFSKYERYPGKKPDFMDRAPDADTGYLQVLILV